MSTSVRDPCFSMNQINDQTTLFREPAVHTLLRSNSWHMKGEDHDRVVNTGLGISSVKKAVGPGSKKMIVAAAIHTHLDHVGRFHKFDNRVVHQKEAAELEEPSELVFLCRSLVDAETVERITEAGYTFPECLVSTIPYEGYDVVAYSVPAAPARWKVDKGDIIDIDSCKFTVLRLPGHNPGSLRLLENSTGTLF